MAYEAIIQVTGLYGIHARPGALIVKVAEQVGIHSDEAFFHNGELSACIKSIMGMLTLDSPKGTTLRLTYEGTPEVFDALCQGLDALHMEAEGKLFTITRANTPDLSFSVK